ncbi:exonuclease 3'-5' domain-containing protein 2 [Callorhinchus milii]|uniref:exonuclease 3'-5' domain-containing protein 2 n=1 Tax=Callorhinchus milii TaxID=7868 RepID=UPI001C3F6A6F|nr:exonuclease 3'-5' domain-containing protein 2 [Callorhinchus milii]XP_042194224.1 exonuclease 3'-5' domain-containing protein 2 [Callorhinchus milii]
MSRPQALAVSAATLLGTAVGCLYLWKTFTNTKQNSGAEPKDVGGSSERAPLTEGKQEPELGHSSRPLEERLLAARVFVVQSEEEWEAAWHLVKTELENYPVLGLDCEWISVRGKRNPVSLLQMASCSGLCVLVRLPQVTRCSCPLPKALLEVLGDSRVLKVGVGIHEDGCKLLRDYCATVRGCVDLRYLAMRQRKTVFSCSPSLKSLAQEVLHITLDKSLHLRCSNWEAEALAIEQITYAAQDARVSMALFFHLLGFSSLPAEGNGPWESEPNWKQVLAKCQGLLDIPFKGKMGGSRGEYRAVETSSQQQWRSKPSIDGFTLTDQKSKDPRRTQRKPLGVGYSARKSPLYDNCFLHAPDGQPLCTCDRKKAQWYIDKGIGELFSEDPFIVKLKFEPSGRPESQEDYYLTAKENLCVVCGKTDSYIRKNIVPHEYRRHFPVEMKDHNSHDVLLLCTTCHATSNCHDNLLKQTLAKEFNAPIGCEEATRLLEDHDRRQVRSGARALLHADSLPQARREELQGILKAFYKTDTLSQELLQEAALLETRIFNESYMPHGLKVMQAIGSGGLRPLMLLEKRWRQHFLDCMMPKYLPPMWSVVHNHSKLLRTHGERLHIQLT